MVNIKWKNKYYFIQNISEDIHTILGLFSCMLAAPFSIAEKLSSTFLLEFSAYVYDRKLLTIERFSKIVFW